MKWLIYAGLIFVLLFLISCINNTTVPTYTIGTPIDQKPIVKIQETELANPCDELICSDDQYCDEGVCVCKPNFRSCDNKCIPVDQCCSSSDCADREVCKDKSCEQVKYCAFNQVFNEQTKKCDCSYGSFWCSYQNSCIPMGNCCGIKDCNSEGAISKLCMPSVPRVYTCIETDKGKHCTFMSLNERSSFSIAGYWGDVFVTSLVEEGVADFKVKSDGNEYFLNNVNIGERIIFANGKYVLSTDKTDIKGGFCSE